MSILDILGNLLDPDAGTRAVFDVLFLVAIVVGTAVAWTFAAVYATFYPWRRNRAGRAVMGLDVALAAIFSIVLLAHAFNDYPGRLFLTLIVFAAVPAALTSLLVALLSKWRHAPGDSNLERGHAVAADFERTIPKRKAK